MSKFSRMLSGSDDSQDSWMHGDAHAKRARRLKIASATTGAMIIGAAVVLAATNWTVGLTGGNGAAQSQSVSNVTVSATTTGSFTNQLFPGANGDVSITITNPNGAPVTVTGVSLPANTTYATGYSDQSLSAAQAGCAVSPVAGELELRHRHERHGPHLHYPAGGRSERLADGHPDQRRLDVEHLTGGM